MNNIQQNFAVGSSWIYFKLYANPWFADHILIHTVAPLIADFSKRQLVVKFFFTRYSDPYFHLRIRLLLCWEADFAAVVKQFYQRIAPLCHCHGIWKTQIDTYSRELERYHPLLIEQVEMLFHCDSISIIQILQQIEVLDSEDLRWIIALKLSDAMLRMFAPKQESRIAIARQMSAGFKAEFGLDLRHNKPFSKKYRQHKTAIENTLNNTLWNSDLATLNSALIEREKSIDVVAQKILEIAARHEINVLLYVDSYLHMTFNRLFPSKNRLHELILCDFLKTHYENAYAKSKYSKND